MVDVPLATELCFRAFISMVLSNPRGTAGTFHELDQFLAHSLK